MEYRIIKNRIKIPAEPEKVCGQFIAMRDNKIVGTYNYGGFQGGSSSILSVLEALLESHAKSFEQIEFKVTVNQDYFDQKKSKK